MTDPSILETQPVPIIPPELVNQSILDTQETPVIPPEKARGWEAILGPDKLAALNNAKNTYIEKTTRAREGVLDGIAGILDRVPNKWVAMAILGAGEMVGIAGYGVTDALTFVQGVNDIVRGRKLEDPDKRISAYLRGGLKIAGALVPAVPSFWVGPVLDKAVPIPEIDNIKKPK